jgi:ABC-2 type transport system permease protein
VIIGFYAAIIAISISGSTDTQKIAVIDRANLFSGRVSEDKEDKNVYTIIQNETEQSFKDKYKQEGYTAFLYIPETNMDHPSGIKLHSQSAINLMAKSKIESKINK